MSLNLNFPQAISNFRNAMKKELLVKTVFYKRIFGGKGFEFDSFRHYTLEDDSSLIDWKATVKANKPLVKQYVEERDIKIFFIIDVGDNMLYASTKKLKAEVCAETAVALSNLILTSGDSIGCLLYSDDIVDILPLSGGKKQTYSFMRTISNINNYGGKSNLKKALEFLSPMLKEVSAVFILSDFIRLTEEDIKMLKEFSLMHETIGIMIRDPVDNNLPKISNEVVIEDPYTEEQIMICPSLIRHEYEANAKYQKNKVRNLFEATGSDLIEITTDMDFAFPLASFLKSRVRKKSKRRRTKR